MVVFANSRKLLGKSSDVLVVFAGLIVAGNGIFWFVLGAIWRFSNAGRVVSGDKLEKTDAQKSNEAIWEEALKDAQYEHGYQLSSGAVMRAFFLYVMPTLIFLLCLAVVLFALLNNAVQ